MVSFTREKVSIEINGQVLEYEDIFSPVFEGTAINEQDAAKLFHRTKELFDEAGIEFALVFGSLLGAVREGGHIIKGDQDMDICVWDEEKLRANLVSFHQKGLKVCRAEEDYLYSFMLDESCYIDVYILRKFRWFEYFPWNLYCIKLYGFVLPRKLFNGWEEIEFLGEKCLCPKDPERFLEFCYGRDWRIPQDSKGTYDVTSLRIARVPLKILKLIFNPEYRKIVFKRRKTTGSFFVNHSR